MGCRTTSCSSQLLWECEWAVSMNLLPETLQGDKCPGTCTGGAVLAKSCSPWVLQALQAKAGQGWLHHCKLTRGPLAQQLLRISRL